MLVELLGETLKFLVILMLYLDQISLKRKVAALTPA
jgi:hypothetical protein